MLRSGSPRGPTVPCRVRFERPFKPQPGASRMFTRAIVLAVSCSALMFGCADQPLDSAQQTQEIINNLVQAGFPADDIMVVDGVVYVGRDAAVSLQASREMLETSGSPTKEQNRTTKPTTRH